MGSGSEKGAGGQRTVPARPVEESGSSAAQAGRRRRARLRGDLRDPLLIGLVQTLVDQLCDPEPVAACMEAVGLLMHVELIHELSTPD